MSIPTYDEYVASLSQLSTPFDPTVPTAEGEEIRAIALALTALEIVDEEHLAALVQEDPNAVPVLGLAVGLTREKLKNVLRHHLGTSSWNLLARNRAGELVRILADQYDLIRLVEKQRGQTFDFGDLLVARAGTRVTAAAAGRTGRRVEDEIEAVAQQLGLPYRTRTRFVGRLAQSAPCDLAIPEDGTGARIVVAAKGFDSTGSKLSDAVREIEDMAAKRLPTQFVMAVVDGIGWKSRAQDLRRIYELRRQNHIDGLFTLMNLEQFRAELERAAKRLDLL